MKFQFWHNDKRKSKQINAYNKNKKLKVSINNAKVFSKKKHWTRLEKLNSSFIKPFRD